MASVGELANGNQRPVQPKVRREGPRRSFLAVAELQNAKIISAVESPRQLYEVLVDFWGNHFNIDVRKGPCRVLKVADDREVIRPHVFGKFRDLLEASAKSPAMLHYLDNFQNSAPRAAFAQRTAPPRASRATECRASAAGGYRRGRTTNRARSAASMRITRGKSWNCTRWAWTAATRRRTCRKWRVVSRAGRLTNRRASSSSGRALTTTARKRYWVMTSRPTAASATARWFSIFWRRIHRLPDSSRQSCAGGLSRMIRRRRWWIASRMFFCKPVATCA